MADVCSACSRPVHARWTSGVIWGGEEQNGGSFNGGSWGVRNRTEGALVGGPGGLGDYINAPTPTRAQCQCCYFLRPTAFLHAETLRLGLPPGVHEAQTTPATMPGPLPARPGAAGCMLPYTPSTGDGRRCSRARGAAESRSAVFFTRQQCTDSSNTAGYIDHPSLLKLQSTSTTHCQAGSTPSPAAT